MKQFLTKMLFKKFLVIALEDILFPMAQKYTEKTDNKWDDQALEFLKQFVNAVLLDMDLADEEEKKKEEIVELKPEMMVSQGNEEK